MLIKNISLLEGSDLKFVANTNIRIQNQKFLQIKSNLKLRNKEESLDGEGLLIIPGFVNCHTHIGDSIAKDFNLNRSVDQKINPISGIKTKILKNSYENHLVSFMRNSCFSMIKKGITTFVDFREGGLEGILLLKRALSDTPLRSVILGRIEFYQGPREIRKNIPFPKNKKDELTKLVANCDGIGISGSNENSSSVLQYYSTISKIRAIHASETKESVLKSIKLTRKSETTRAMDLKPHILVHMTYSKLNELHFAKKQINGIVICPRANAALAEGIPDIELMKKAGIPLALGTDNIMVNSPDMFREMDYLWKTTMGIHKKRIDPKEILKMATVNGGKILKKNIGVISKDKLADCIFLDKHDLDLEPMHDPYASIVHRASESTIRAIMIGGKIIHGKI